MKNIILTSLLTFFSLTIFSQDWNVAHPIDDYTNLLDGYFEDENNLIIVGYQGTIRQSSNGGQDWNSLPPFTDKNFKFIKPIPNSNGQQLLLAAEDAIYKSVDAGVTWNLKTTDLVIDDVITLEVVNANLIYASAREDQFLKSTDGGDTWEITNSGTNAFFWEMSFITDDEGFGLTYNGQLYHTTNGGMVWDSLSTIPAVSGRTVYFENSNVGYASGFWSQLFITTDGGLTWSDHSATGYPPQAYELKTTATNGNWYCRSQNGSEVFFSMDEGLNWSNYTPMSDNNARFRSIDILDDGKIYLVGEFQTVLKSEDWGSTWIDFFQFPKNTLAAVKFKNENIGIAVGGNNRILKTTDGGNTWQVVSEANATAFDIEIDANGDWHLALGYSGIWKSSDDGATWIQKLDSDPAVISLDQAPNGNLFGVSDIGEKSVFRSTDNGETWSEISLNTVWKVLQIEFISDTKGYVITKDGLLITNDGGDTWTEDLSNSFSNIKRLFFLDENTGWINVSNLIFKTTDGGTTWEQQSSAGGQAVLFLNENKGFSVGGSFDDGKIFLTEDGGASWQQVYGAPYFIREIVSVGNSNNIVAVGNGGQIILGFDETNFTSNLISKNDLRIYPNPGNEFVILDHHFKNGELTIFNLQGQIVFRKNLNQESQPIISTSLLNSGTFFFKVVDEKKEWIGKWIKE